ncbi:alpha/beta fold hydrolase [Glaciihabitans sp. INWT7]|uniref:alpha/beta fold hydrolase n=1 Tax=Glaciihabitans sp. INWT7 TaxID=2596912 RepID=UPI001CA4973D|nr:alpha/beta fold hydrolase [Glaciihabitans sp. INWT7]
MSRSHSRGWRMAIGAALLFILSIGGAVPVAAAAQPKGASESFKVAVPSAPGSTATVGIDVDLYLPAASRPSPAVLLAHGFGGSKRSLAKDAERLRREGYVVMAYSARGFGRSGGRISLDALDYEVADAKRLVDVLASRPEVEKRNGDPVVGVVGASYGGALALMLGATDPRVDTVVAAITWNDLAQALVPQADSAAPGVFKQAWATQLFGAAASPFEGACGRFTAELCTLYTKLVAGGQLDATDRTLLEASSPASVLSGMTAPTLLLQGRQDTLFGFDQADANARQIAAAGAEVQVSWFAGGHDGGQIAGTTSAVDEWLSAHLRGGSSSRSASETFSFTVPASARGFAETRVAARYPGLDGTSTRTLPLKGRFGIVINPPGGLPATISSLPGIGSVDSVVGGIGSGIAGTAVQPAQQAKFSTGAISAPFVLAGSPTVTVDVRLPRFRDRDPVPAAAPVEVLLFAQLRVSSGGSDLAVGGGVAPIHVSLPADGSATRVQVRLPATTWQFEKGDTVAISLRTTDAGYQGSPAAASFVVNTEGTLSLPTVAATAPAVGGGAPSTAALIGIPIVVLLGLILAVIAALADRRRDRAVPTPVTAGSRAEDAPPLVIRGLTKDYRAGFRAVDDLTFTVERGQVLGLLGPNGAGKTTALRMVTGLLRPDAGEIEIFGERVSPGSRVLTRVGCFIEGPGFLSHLSGRRNLQLFWAASGRPRSEARLDEALAIADLGTAVNRRVGGYSQGMKQRLAIAQAMLGMPELLILDEPTNGLDPPQIFALRGVLRRYAETGRTVIVSSHLLGEVEQTCSDVVVMARGRLIAAGPVAELAGENNELTLEVTDVDAAVTALLGLDGVEASILAGGTLRVVPSQHSAESVVAAIAAAGVGIRSVTRGRHLEETFLAMVGSEGIV